VAVHRLCLRGESAARCPSARAVPAVLRHRRRSRRDGPPPIRAGRAGGVRRDPDPPDRARDHRRRDPAVDDRWARVRPAALDRNHLRPLRRGRVALLAGRSRQPLARTRRRPARRCPPLSAARPRRRRGDQSGRPPARWGAIARALFSTDDTLESESSGSVPGRTSRRRTDGTVASARSDALKAAAP